MKYVENNIGYSDMIKYVDVIVNNSFGKSGRYHKYLREYAETVVLAKLFTDYSFEENGTDEDKLIENALSIYHSEEWQNDILPQIPRYAIMCKYIDYEIEQRIRPFAEVNELVHSVTQVLDELKALISAIDKDALQNLNLSDLADALGALNPQTDYEVKPEEEDNTDK